MLYLDLVASVKDNPAVKNQTKEVWVEFLLKVSAWNEISILSIFHTHILTRFHFKFCSNKAKQINMFLLLFSKVTTFRYVAFLSFGQVWSSSYRKYTRLQNQKLKS